MQLVCHIALIKSVWLAQYANVCFTFCEGRNSPGLDQRKAQLDHTNLGMQLRTVALSLVAQVRDPQRMKSSRRLLPP